MNLHPHPHPDLAASKWVLATGVSPSCVVVVPGLSGLLVLRFSQYLCGSASFNL